MLNLEEGLRPNNRARFVAPRMIGICAFTAVLAACGGGTDEMVLAEAGDEAEAGVIEPTARKPRKERSAPVVESPDADTLNSVDEIVNDMKLLNDGPLKDINPDYAWATGPGMNVMGNDPRGTNTPSWFKPTDTSLLSSTYWRAILPWFVMMEGTGNSATNTRIQIRNLTAMYKSRADGQWRTWGVANDFWGTACPQSGNYAGCNGSSDKRFEPDGGVSFRPASGLNFHGWWTLGHAAIQPADIAAVHITAQVRLVPHNPALPLDGSGAKYLIAIGADYYPYANYDMGTQANPGVGKSRSKYITQNWRPVSMTTFSDVGLQFPGGGIREAEFRAAPPPVN
jgi:hypothetical protein